MSVILSLAASIEATPWSTALRESEWAYPIIQSSHVLGLALFLGLTVLMDLRLVGRLLTFVPVGVVMSRLLPWVRAGFGLMAVSGAILVVATPVNYVSNVFMQAKLVLLILAGLNIWVFHSRLYPSVAEWGDAAVPPRGARLAGACSLTLWTLTLAAGRLVAYNWFN